MIVVTKPEFVVVKRKDKAPVGLGGVTRAFIQGGSQVAGNGYQKGDRQSWGTKFSFGFQVPDRVQLFRANGQEARFKDVESILFSGGIPASREDYQRIAHLASQIEAGFATDLEIADDRATHLVDNEATIAVADEVPRGNFRDDFWDRVRQLNEAAIGPRGELLDEFDQLWQLQGAHHADLNAEAPFKRTNPPSATKDILGSQATIFAGTGLPATMPQLLEVARFDGDDADTLPITVTAFPVNFTPVAGLSGAIQQPFVRLRWGTRGYSASMDVDIGKGCQFTVNGSFASLSLGMDEVAGNPTNQQFVGMLSFRPCVRTTPMFRTIYTADVAATQLQAPATQVPVGAKKVWIFASGTGIAFTADFTSTNATTQRYRYTQAAGGLMTQPIPLSDDIWFITCQNNDNMATVKFCYIFELTV